MACDRQPLIQDATEHEVSLWTEALFGAEYLLLHATPVYYGFGVQRGDGSAVIVIPGFLGTDLFLMELYAWLARIGYRSYFSGIGLNAECPNLLIRERLNESIDKARAETGRKVHLVGHSLGGIIARSAACQRKGDVASVITLAAPFRGAAAQKNILRAAEIVRQNILRQHGPKVLPECYTGRCTCEFIGALRTGGLPSCVAETAIYTRSDCVVDWRYCITGDPDVDCEVPGTHLGLVFNASVYSIIANRLADVTATETAAPPHKTRPNSASEDARR